MLLGSLGAILVKPLKLMRILSEQEVFHGFASS